MGATERRSGDDGNDAALREEFDRPQQRFAITSLTIRQGPHHPRIATFLFRLSKLAAGPPG
jgi:hypothetical protein